MTIVSIEFVYKMTMVEDKPYKRASKQNGSTDDSLKNRTKYRTTVIIVLVSSCLVALAVALTVVFVFAKPQNEKLSTKNAGRIRSPYNL